MPSTGIINLQPAHEAEAVALMARAFADDALMRYLFDGESTGYGERLRGFFRYTSTVHRTLGWPILGAIARTRLAGAAYIATPDETGWPDTLNEAYASFTGSFGTELLERLQRYATLPAKGMPNVPHYYIKAIGVRPESQGRGYAHALLEAVHAQAEAHPAAKGVGLDTEKPANVPLYQRFGYELRASVPFNGMEVFYLFRPNQR